MNCEGPISFESLVAYWLGDLPEDRAAPLEEHLFGCVHCTRRLEALVALASGVRAAVREGKLSLVVSGRFVAELRQAGLRLREYRLGPGDSVNCTIRPDDDAVVSHLRVPLAGVRRLDVVSTLSDGGPPLRVAEVPFDAESGEVFIIPSAAWLKTMPAFTMRLRLVSVDDAREEMVGEYTFNHAPS